MHLTSSSLKVVAPQLAHLQLCPQWEVIAWWSLRMIKTWKASVQGSDSTDFSRNPYSYLSGKVIVEPVFNLSQSLYRKLRCLILGGQFGWEPTKTWVLRSCPSCCLLKGFAVSPYFKQQHKVMATSDLLLSMFAMSPEIKYSYFIDKELTTSAPKDRGT